MRPAVFATTSLAATFTALVATSAAFAQPTAAPGGVPDQCKAVATAPADATIELPGLVAKVSLAYCGAQARFSALKLAPDDASLKALNDAAKPSFELLDAVIAKNDPVASDLAHHLRSQLLVSMAVRMRITVPPITMQTVGPQLAELMKLHDDLEPKIKPWLDAAGPQQAK